MNVVTRILEEKSIQKGGREATPFQVLHRDTPTGTHINYSAIFELYCASEGAYSDCSVNGAFQRHKLSKIDIIC
jgi:hypothetical protein